MGNSPCTRRYNFWTRSKADTCNRSRAKPTVVPSRSNRTSSCITQPSPHSQNASQHCEDGTPTTRTAEEILSRMIESGIEPPIADSVSRLMVRGRWHPTSGRTMGYFDRCPIPYPTARPFGSCKYVETGASLYVGPKRQTKLVTTSPPLVRTPPPPVRRHHQIAASGRDP